VAIEPGMKRLIGTVVAVSLLSACGGVGSDPAGPGAQPPPDSPVSSSPVDPNNPLPSPTPRIVEPQPGLTDIRPQPWESMKVLDPRTLQVAFYSGVHECYGVDRVEVDYGSKAVTVSLFIGRVPGNQVCVEIAEFQAVEVELDEPLGGREIVDGGV
jgi:hypothetical protein